MKAPPDTPTPARTKKQLQGAQSREAILDAAERLMAARGYAGTAIADIRNESGMPPSSIYWHFGSKNGVLAAVMERGAERWFASIPRWEELEGPDAHRQAQMVGVWARSLSEHPDFLRLFYILSLEAGDDATVAEIVRRVRDTAIERFREGVRHLMPPAVKAARAERVVDELTAFAVAASDGFFFAAHLEPEATDLQRLCLRLGQALIALRDSMLAERP